MVAARLGLAGLAAGDSGFAGLMLHIRTCDLHGGCSGEREHGNDSVTCVRTGPWVLPKGGALRAVCVMSPGNRIWLVSTGGWSGGEFSFLF